MMYRVGSFFAGVGGIDLAFEQTGACKSVYANEFDKYAAETYEKNFPVKVDVRDVNLVTGGDIPEVDIVTGGFPCQPFSIAGHQQGFDDEKNRGKLFFQLIRIIKDKKPKAVLLENVKALASHDDSTTISIIMNEFLKIGYYAGYKVLNAKDYGNIPQNRERIYIVAFRGKEVFERFRWPKPVTLQTRISDVIDFRGRIDEKYYYRKGKFLMQNGSDIYDALLQATLDDNIESPGVFQWRRKYVRKNKNGVIPTLTANQGGGGHNVCIVKTYYGIRKMTPRECFNAQGFPPAFRLPEQSDSRLYKQAGNSVCIPVVRRIALNMIRALDGEKGNQSQIMNISNNYS